MRRSILIVAGLLLPLGEALAGSWMVGGSLGRAMGDTSAGALDSQLAAQGLDATASSSDDHRTAKKIYLGYQYTSNLGLEFGYVDLGQVNTTFSGTTVDINSFLSSAGDIHPQTAQGWQISGIYRHPFEKSKSLKARFGLLAWQSDYTLSTSSISRDLSNSGTSTVLGVGIEIVAVQAIFASIDLDYYKIDNEPISVVSVGISYSFE